ncbi:MAG TPA: hypothetical protein VGJ70_10985 [Solirubrobacteraceae bacterium]|jgi:hypothetical protein
MNVPSVDPRVAIVVGVATVPPFRRVVGRGIGYVARGVMVAGSPVADAGRDIYESAREVARGDGRAKSTKKAATGS